jgi:hypothetical protein
MKSFEIGSIQRVEILETCFVFTLLQGRIHISVATLQKHVSVIVPTLRELKKAYWKPNLSEYSPIGLIIGSCDDSVSIS